MKNSIRRVWAVLKSPKTLTMLFLLVMVTSASAQGQAALTNAASTISGYWTAVKSIIYAIGGIVGLIGGVRIYNKWTNGDHDINKEIVGWGGACLFLIIVPTFVQSFFG